MSFATSSDLQQHNPWLSVNGFAAILCPTVVVCDDAFCSELQKDLQHKILLAAASDKLLP